ncbi:MAG TPA: AAA family ATPase, partial [Anaerolineae bacterium]
MQAHLRRGDPSLDQNWALAGEAAPPQLQVWLLGEFRLLYGSVPVTSVNTPRLQALLAYLLLHREAPQPRRHLAFLFWSDTTETQALTNLRNLLHKLRQALPDAGRFFDSDAHGIQWRSDAPCVIDVFEFDQAAASTGREDLSRAADLYRGDLLPSCYDDWIGPEREQRQRLAGQMLERLIELLAAAGDYKAAIGYGQRLRQLDPLNEATYHTIMRLHAGNLDRAGVMRTYHACAQTLQTELGAEPSPATRELYEHLLAGAAAPAPAAAARAAQIDPRLVGRHAEWDKLQAAYVSANNGKPTCVILTGEAGIGKTRLAEEMLAWAGHQNAAVAQARCYAAEGALSFGPVVTWLRTPALHQRLLALPPVWAGEAARLIPELHTKRSDLGRQAPLDELSQRQRLFEALARAALGPEHTLVLLVDDLQWCDRDTIEWLHYLLRFDARSRLLVLGTARIEDLQDNLALGRFLTALSRDSRLTEIPLGR